MTEFLNVTTPEEKRELQEYLEQHDPDTLQFLKLASQEFGLLDKIDYRSKKGNE